MTIRQDRPEGGIRVLNGGHIIRIDSDGSVEWKVDQRLGLEGSFDSRVDVRCDGYASQEYSLGKAEAAQAIMHLEFPFVGEVEFMRVTNGDVTRNIVMGVRPLERIPKDQKAV